MGKLQDQRSLLAGTAFVLLMAKPNHGRTVSINKT